LNSGEIDHGHLPAVENQDLLSRRKKMFDRTMVRGLMAAGLVAILLAAEANAWTQDITYNIVDYPVNETDVITGGTDTISGTITTDGSLGALTSQNIVRESISLYNSMDGTSYFEAPVSSSFSLISGQLSASRSQLLLSNGGECQIYCSTIEADPPTLAVTYDNGYDNQLQFSGSIIGGTVAPHPFFQSFLATNPPDTAGSIGSGGSTWVIATVPEPATLTLLGSALLGVAALYLRRRGAKA
jgi:hypothetical protein